RPSAGRTAPPRGDAGVDSAVRSREPPVGVSADPRGTGEARPLVSATTIHTLLGRHGLGPTPRPGGVSWRRFLRQQAASTLACDFLTIETVWLKTLYVLFFIELGRRRVHLGGCTASPDATWVTQQARNLARERPGAEAQVRFLARDRDSKFPRAFDE